MTFAQQAEQKIITEGMSPSGVVHQLHGRIVGSRHMADVWQFSDGSELAVNHYSDGVFVC